MIPMAAVIAIAGIAKAIVDAAIEAHFSSPVSGVEGVATADPAPIGWRPQQFRLWRLHPGARYPVVITFVGIPGPVAGHPDIALRGNDRLLVIGKRWRHNLDTDVDRELGLHRR